MNENNKIIKSELIELIAEKQKHLSFQDVEDSVHCILDHMSEALEKGQRIEIRGFGAFSLRHRTGWLARNPKTGEKVLVPEKHVPHFKPGKVLNGNLNMRDR